MSPYSQVDMWKNQAILAEIKPFCQKGQMGPLNQNFTGDIAYGPWIRIWNSRPKSTFRQRGLLSARNAWFGHFLLHIYLTTKMFLIRCCKHTFSHQMLISLSGMKRFWKELVSGSCVLEMNSFWGDIRSSMLHSCPKSVLFKIFSYLVYLSTSGGKLESL